MNNQTVRLAVATIGTLFVATTRAFSCQCMAQYVSKRLANSTNAFRAQVIGEKLIDPTGAETRPHKRYRVKVLEDFKGRPPAIVTFDSGMGGGDCGVSLSVGAEELFFIGPITEKLFVNMCSTIVPDKKALAVARGEADDEKEEKLRDPTPDNEKRQSQQHYLSGVIFFQKGDYSNAKKEWVESSSLDPFNNDPKEGLKRIQETYDYTEKCKDGKCGMR